jgi:hypothetical protein
MAPTIVYLCVALCALAVERAVWAADSDTRLERVTYAVKPSEADPNITRFDDPNLIMFNRDLGPDAQLVVFLPGTNGVPANAKLLLGVVADQGYRVIGLDYNDSPAVAQICQMNPAPKCSGDFRQRRAFGTDSTSVVSDTLSESIVSRLANLLHYLDHTHPEEGWQGFLFDDHPNWRRIVLSGLSQGAGMAAYIAKQESVARVVLFSSPWDSYGRAHTLAPWIIQPSKTPPNLWFGEYHRREGSAELIADAYRGLQIPAANIRVFDLGLPSGSGIGKDLYHVSTIRNSGYVDQWRFLFGHSP